MTGRCWRLLAALSMIFVAPAVLRGQDVALDSPAGQTSTATTRPFSGRTWHQEPAVVLGPDPAPIVNPLVLQKAGIIFSGRVIFVGHSASSTSQTGGFTVVTFQVEHAIRGTTAGQKLTIHEWAGLWERGERYRVGERVGLFLYAPSRLGLTSAVAGTRGRFGIDQAGMVVYSKTGEKTLASYPDFERGAGRAIDHEMRQP